MVTPSNIFSEQEREENSTFELFGIAKSFDKFPNFMKENEDSSFKQNHFFFFHPCAFRHPDVLHKKRTSACIVLLLETTLCSI